MSLVSVIIPCYNSEAWLGETLASVIGQTWKQLEIILVDDGSGDSTASIIRQFEALHPELVKTVFGPNQGAASARNAGLALAKGDYIQYLDADDLLLPDAIAARVEALERSGADVAYSDWQKLQEAEAGRFMKGECIMRTVEQIDPELEVALFTTFWSPPAALLYTRDIVAKIGVWKQHLAPVEDARYMLDAALNGGRYIHVPQILALYRIFHGASHSRRSPLKFVSAIFSNAKEVEAHWKANGSLDDKRKQALASCYGYVARHLFKLSPSLFDEALSHLYALRPGFELSWPKTAGVMKKIIGTRMNATMLALLGKPV